MPPGQVSHTHTHRHTHTLPPSPSPSHLSLHTYDPRYPILLAFLIDLFLLFPEFGFSSTAVFLLGFAIISALISSTARARATAARRLWALSRRVAGRHAELDRALTDLLPTRHARALRAMLLLGPPPLPAPPAGARPLTAEGVRRRPAGAGAGGLAAAGEGGGYPAAETCAAAVLCADLVGFTKLTGRLGPDRTFGLMHELWCEFDRLVEERCLSLSRSASVCLCLPLSVSVFFCLSVSLSVCLSVCCLSVCLSVCLAFSGSLWLSLALSGLISLTQSLSRSNLS
jgi:hypothetical protein